MNIILQTPRIIIREFTPVDLRLLLLLDADERLTQFVKKRSVEESKRIFKESLTEYKKDSGLGRWGMFNPTDDDFIGVCMLRPSDCDVSSIELGYRLHYKYWGAGIATELSKALVAYGINKLGLKEICAVTHPDNTVSQRVLEKAGFVKHGNVTWYGEELPFFKTV